jgi:hypothetical protein
MSNDKLPISLASFLISSIVPKLMERDMLGRMYIRLGRVLTLSIWLYETGAILGRFWKDKLSLVVKMFEVEEKRDEFTRFWRNEANKRLELYGSQPHTFPTFVGETDLKLFDGKTLQELPKIGDKKLHHNEGQQRLRLAESSLVEGIMFGGMFPDLTHLMLVNQYQKTDMDSWRRAREYGLTLSESPPYKSVADKEKEVTAMARDYVGEYFPELMEPLGLAGI